MFVIYKAEFPNGKVYIGKSKDFDQQDSKMVKGMMVSNQKEVN